MNRTVGISLIAIGVILLIWSAFTYYHRIHIINAGPVQISVADKQEPVDWPPYAGGILIIGGVIILATSKRNI